MSSAFSSFIRPFSNIKKIPTRTFSQTKCNYLKRVEIKTEGDLTTIEGKYIDSDRKDFLINKDQEYVYCSLCPKKLPAPVKYTDVLILSQFVDSRGAPLPMHVTGLCYRANYRLQRLVDQAQTAGLMKRPPGHPELAKKWNKYNIYYDE